MKTIRALFLISLTALPLAAQRLPKSVIPHHYDITFAPDFNTDTFSGVEAIEISVQKPTREITLNALDITFGETSIEAGGRSQTAGVNLDRQKQTATLTVPEDIPIGPARVHIRYSGILNNELRGLYLGRANGRKYAGTQMEAADARRAFPSFDEPELKATFAISAIIDDADKAISNGAVISDTSGPDPGKHTIRFATTPRMSTYLVALVVGDFACVEGGSDGVPMRVCATPDKVHLGKLALSMSENFMTWFHQYFGVPYPFGKLDHIGIADFAAGAMENSGAIIYRDPFLLKDEKTASIDSQKGLAGIVSHEMAHMWFGDLVTMRWWDDLWLNEGFASWIGSKPIHALHPEWKTPVDEVQSIGFAMNADSLQNNRPIRVGVKTVEQAEELFDSITYGKAAAVLGMIESFLGEETFRKGVAAYLSDHAFRNATSDDFSAALSDAAGDVPVDRIFDTFVKQPGVPVLSADASCVNDRTIVKVRQRRFFLDPRLVSRESEELWQIPVCFRLTGSKEKTCRVVSDRKQTLRLDGCSSPVFLNAGGRGYYITATELPEIRKLAGRMGSLSEPEKVVLLRDEWFLVRSTRRSIADFLNLADSVLDTERDRAVVDQLLGSLGTIVRWVPAGEREAYREWLRSQLHPLVSELGWEVKPGDDPDRRSLRASLISTLGVTARDPQVLAEARRRAVEYLKNPASIDPSLVGAILSAAAVEGDESLYEQVLAALEQPKNPEERFRLQGMLSSFRNPRLMRRTMNRALLPETRTTEALGYIGSVMRSREGREMGWEFVTSRWTDLEKKLTPAPLRSFVGGVGSFCDPAMRDEAKRFFTEHKVQAAERLLAQSLESIDLCIQTTRAQMPKLTAWLKQREQQVAASSSQ